MLYRILTRAAALLVFPLLGLVFVSAADEPANQEQQHLDCILRPNFQSPFSHHGSR